MKKNKATIVDIARKLNVAPSTVSRALNDDYQISDKTKEAVLKLAKEMHYVPNSVALSLLKKRSYLIGIIVPAIANHFCSTIISSIDDTLHSANYNLMTFQSNEKHKREMKIIDVVLKSGIDGLLVSVSQQTEDFKHLLQLKEYGIPIVLFDRVLQDFPSSQVRVDNFGGAFMGVEHLINEGCRRIAHISGPETLQIARERKAGYLKALQKYQLDFDEDLIVECDLNEIDNRESTRKLLDLKHPPDAIFCAANPLGAYLELKDRNICIPKEIALLGFTDDPLTEFIYPPISTVNQPIKKMGKLAAKLLLEEIESEQDSQFKSVVLKPQLSIRASSLKSKYT